MGITKNHIDASHDILNIMESWMENEQSEIDSTEAISIIASLAGSFLFRSFGLKLDNVKPGTIINIHSEEEKTKENQLIILTHSSLELLGIKTNINKTPNEYIKHAKSNFLDVINKVQGPAVQIMKKYNLSYEQMAQSAVIATAFFIQKRKEITIDDGLETAIYYYYVGSRTYPPDFE